MMVGYCLQIQLKSNSTVSDQRKDLEYARIIRVVFDSAEMIALQMVHYSSCVFHHFQNCAEFVRILQSHQCDLRFVAVVLVLKN